MSHVSGLAFLALILAISTGCRRGEFEYSLDQKVIEHLRTIVLLEKSIADLETELASFEDGAAVMRDFREISFSQWNQPKRSHVGFPERGTELFVVLEQWEIESGYLTEIAGDGDLLREKLGSGKGYRKTCPVYLRVAAGQNDLGDVSRAGALKRYRTPGRFPDPEEKVKRIRKRNFGAPLDSLILMRSVTVEENGEKIELSAAKVVGSSLIQVKLDVYSKERGTPVSVPIYTQGSGERTTLTASGAGLATESSGFSTDILLTPNQWSLARYHSSPESNQPSELLLIKVIPVK